MNEIKKLPLTLGINTTYKGYNYLVASLEIAVEDPDALLLYTKCILPDVARRYHTTSQCVERNIRTAIHAVWKSNTRRELIRICPYELEKRPTVSEFLDILHWQLTKEEE